MVFPQYHALYQSHVIETHIMIGDHLLIVPVLKEDATSYHIFFPTGRWYLKFNYFYLGLRRGNKNNNWI